MKKINNSNKIIVNADKTGEYAKTHTSIDEEEMDLVMACRRSVLFSNGKTWTKKDKDFDVTMGAQYGAEIAELTGIYLLKQVEDFLASLDRKAYTGLYRDDGLIYIEEASGPLINKIEKALHRIFKSNHLKISVEQKGHTVNFLDATLGTNGSYKPYKKPNGTTKYVNKASNHPPSILKNIPKFIQKRLNTISSSEDEFGGAKDEYQKALEEAGYTDTLTYDPNINQTNKPKRKRSRRIIWYNPPYSKNVATNIGKEFFKLLRLHFPKQHPLHRLFNNNTVKDHVRSCNSIIVKADKTRNMYAMEKEQYEKLLSENITKDYRKADENHTKNINKKCKRHAVDLNIENRMEKITERKAFISIKDHKSNFPNKIQCRLINPARNNLGKVAQQIIRSAVKSIKEKSGLNLWMGTNDVLDWYKTNMHTGTLFIQYDIEAYYPNITEPLLDKAIDFARGFCNISENDKGIIKTCRQSILFGSNNQSWTKKDSNFDVTMGSLDGAKISELIGLFMLNEIKNNIRGLNSTNNGLYRDDGLIMLGKCPGPRKEKLIKELHRLFMSHGLKITIASTGPSANYLDVTMDLSDGSYRPYRKPNDTPVYINAASNHPPSVLKHIPKMVEKRLQSISSDEAVFNNAKPAYEEALKSSGFDTFCKLGLMRYFNVLKQL